MPAIRAARRLAVVLAGSMLLAAALGTAAQASSWHLVPSFGRGGVAGLPLRERRQEAPSQGAPGPPERDRSLVVAGTGGSLIVGGYAASKRGAFLIARLSGNGRLVKSFGHGGVSTVPGVYWFKTDPPRILPLAGGKLLVVGLNHADQLVAVRLRANGAPDHGFGHAGVAQYTLAHTHGFTIITAATIEADGDVLLVYEKELPQPENQPRVPEGQGNGVIEYARLLPSGALDLGFGAGGFQSSTQKPLGLIEGESGTLGSCAETLTTGGSLLIAYQDLGLEQLAPGGEPLTGFGAGAATAPSTGGPLAADERYFFCAGLFALPANAVEGVAGHEFTRLTAAGAPDPAFGKAGSVKLAAPVEATAFGAGGEVFAAGASGGELTLAAVLADGQPDPALGGSAGKRFAVRLAGASAEEKPTWEVLPAGNGLSIRFGEEVIRLSH